MHYHICQYFAALHDINHVACWYGLSIQRNCSFAVICRNSNTTTYNSYIDGMLVDTFHWLESNCDRCSAVCIQLICYRMHRLLIFKCSEITVSQRIYSFYLEHEQQTNDFGALVMQTQYTNDTTDDTHYQLI